jgi:hypothetical protein
VMCKCSGRDGCSCCGGKAWLSRRDLVNIRESLHAGNSAEESSSPAA